MTLRRRTCIQRRPFHAIGTDACTLVAAYLDDVPPWLLLLVEQRAIQRVQRTLVYGHVQSGKTARIISEAVALAARGIRVLIVLQNSLLQLKQLMARLAASKVNAQLIDGVTERIVAPVCVIIHNRFRLGLYAMLAAELDGPYAVIVDEADAVRSDLLSRLLHCACREVHVTATPFTLGRQFSSVVVLPTPEGYCGVDTVQTVGLTPNNQSLVFDSGQTVLDADAVVDDFCSAEGDAMLLVVTQSRLTRDIHLAACELSARDGVDCCVALAAQRALYRDGQKVKEFTAATPLSHIIDSVATEPQTIGLTADGQHAASSVAHIAFCAHAIATRGLSFVSSDYSRCLTHQVIQPVASVTVNLQRCRIFGVYKSVHVRRLALLPGVMQDIKNTVHAFRAEDYIDASLTKVRDL